MANQTVDQWIDEQINVADMALLDAEIDGADQTGYQARLDAIEQVAVEIVTNPDVNLQLRDWIREADHTVCDHDPDSPEGIKWNARLVALEDLWSLMAPQEAAAA